MGKKIWLNGKYIKIKQNQKLKAKFFQLFQVLDTVKKQAYKLKLLKKRKIYDIFFVLLLKQDITEGKRINKFHKLKPEIDNDKDYEIKAIYDNIIYANKVAESKLPELYCFIFWKDYLKSKSIW